jgi:predicted DNA-binding transcriptional regulator AlpA
MMDPKDVRLTAPQLRHRYGGRSDMWLWRLLHNQASDFPQPLRINGRRYWRLGDIEAWELAQAAQRQPAKQCGGAPETSRREPTPTTYPAGGCRSADAPFAAPLQR